MELKDKYRPKQLEDIMGQPKVVEQLRQMVGTQVVQSAKPLVMNCKVPHALLLSGPSGVGKTATTRVLKLYLECSDIDYNKINTADFTGIRHIRELRGRLGVKPCDGGKSRIIVFDEAHQLTKDSQEAMLEMLEEPPAHLYFMLTTTSPKDLIETVHTRCTHLQYQSLPDDELVNIITTITEREGKQLEPEVISKIVTVVDGSARKALVILEQVIDLPTLELKLESILSPENEEKAFTIAQELMKPKKGRSWDTVRKILSSKLDMPPEGARRLIRKYANTVMLKSTANSELGHRANLVLIAFGQMFYDAYALSQACWEVMNTD